jgi:hypothetical protein
MPLSTDKVKTLHRHLGHPLIQSSERLVKDQIILEITGPEASFAFSRLSENEKRQAVFGP